MSNKELGLCIRINGTLSPVLQLGKQSGASANTSCSLFDIQEKGENQKNTFHLLVDCGNGVIESIKQGSNQHDFIENIVPDAMLITHGHRDHIDDVPVLLSELEKKNHGPGFKIYCTGECLEQITKQFPSLSQKSSAFSSIVPGQVFEVGPFLIEPILAKHDDLPGAVIYIIKVRNKKIVVGWDFESLPGAEQASFWNPDLVILGAETYNDHKFSTGMISISDAYNIIRSWNAKNCYIVHYSGQKDIEDAKNQWFRGPTRPLKRDELQTMIDDHLRVTGDSGKFNLKVAQEGMIWMASKVEAEEAALRQSVEDNSAAIGDKIEIEGLEKYVLIIEKKNEENKLEVTIEDSINRLTSEFSEPYVNKNDNEIRLEAKSVKSFIMKGPELRMSLTSEAKESLLSLSIIKGKKSVFEDNIKLTSTDTKRLARYMTENFSTTS